MDDVKSYVKERDRILSAMDLDAARKAAPGLRDEVLTIGMHKARVECVRIDAELRRESMAWLKERGYSRLFGLPWDADEALPE